MAYGWGEVERSTSHVEDLVIPKEDHFKNFILFWSNKLQRPLEETKLLIKEEKDGGYSRVTVKCSQASQDEVLQETRNVYFICQLWPLEQTRHSAAFILSRLNMVTHCSMGITSKSTHE